MKRNQQSFVVREAMPWFIASALGLSITFRFWGYEWALIPALFMLFLFLFFRDPYRAIPPLPLAVVAPVDGRVIAAGLVSDTVLPGNWNRIVIRVSHLGAYTIRSPIEGKILDVRDRTRGWSGGDEVRGLWLNSEEDDDVVLLFPGWHRRFGPKAFVSYGERLGQGQRFAYLRLATRAEIYFPPSARINVQVGDRVTAGAGVLAELVRE